MPFAAPTFLFEFRRSRINAIGSSPDIKVRRRLRNLAILLRNLALMNPCLSCIQ
jgi:hypothetical protein